MSPWNAISAASLLLTAVVAVPAAGSPAPAAEQEKSWDSYRLLVERNIFLRDRRRRVPRAPLPRAAPRVAPDSDRDIVLTGIGRRDGEYVAFFENAILDVTVRLQVGQDVGKGKIKAITLDAVQYDRGGSVTRIEVGDALQGGRFIRETVAAAPPPATQPAGPSTSPTSQPEIAASQPAPSPRPPASGGGEKSSDVADILKRMRERRARELRK
jgi:hypothetical protein